MLMKAPAGIDKHSLVASVVSLAASVAASELGNRKATGFCPTKAVLRQLALQQAFGKIDRNFPISHVATCPACVAAFNAVKRDIRLARQLRRFGTAAALVTFASALLYWSLRNQNPSTEVIVPKEVASTSPELVELTVDLAGRAPLRGGRAPALPIVLPAAEINLRVLLPVGLEPGDYQVRFSNGAHVIADLGLLRAALLNNATTLRFKVDLRGQSGEAQLTVQRSGFSPRNYRIRIVENR